MRTKLVALICAGLLATTVASASNTLRDSNNNPVSPTLLSGKWIILSFWASWCGACEMEAPELNRVYENNRNNNVIVYGVDFDQQSNEEAASGAKKLGIQYPLLFGDPRLAWALGEVSVLPTTFIINPDGKVVEKILGAHNEAFFNAQLVALQKQ